MTFCLHIGFVYPGGGLILSRVPAPFDLIKLTKLFDSQSKYFPFLISRPNKQIGCRYFHNRWALHAVSFCVAMRRAICSECGVPDRWREANNHKKHYQWQYYYIYIQWKIELCLLWVVDSMVTVALINRSVVPVHLSVHLIVVVASVVCKRSRARTRIARFRQTAFQDTENR